jgi:thiamine-phosphate pyrophosphorylase
VTPAALDPKPFAAALAAACDSGDVAAVQLRLKDAGDDAIRRAAETLRPIAQDRGAAFILNDRPDLAAQTGCDGVHIGQSDASYAAARAAVGPNRIVGVTCHDSRHLAITAADQGADYVAFGAFYPTKTKDASGHPTPDLLRWWSEIMTVPCVAIGGIMPANLEPLVAAGADFIAVCSGVWEHPDGPASAVADYRRAILLAEEIMS